MSIVVNGITIPTAKGGIVVNDTVVQKVDVIKDGETTTVWTSAEPKLWTLEISDSPFGTEKSVDISADISQYSTATLEVSGGAFGYGNNGSFVDLSWYGTISESGTHTVPLGTGTMKLHCGGDNAYVSCTLTFS